MAAPMHGEIRPRAHRTERIPRWSLNEGRNKEPAMADEIQQPPFIYEGLDPAENEDRFGIRKLSAAVKSLNDMLEGARKPGMPLSILSNVAREAPLGSLLVAFVLGIAIGRRR